MLGMFSMVQHAQHSTSQACCHTPWKLLKLSLMEMASCMPS